MFRFYWITIEVTIFYYYSKMCHSCSSPADAEARWSSNVSWRLGDGLVNFQCHVYESTGKALVSEPSNRAAYIISYLWNLKNATALVTGSPIRL